MRARVERAASQHAPSPFQVSLAMSHICEELDEVFQIPSRRRKFICRGIGLRPGSMDLQPGQDDQQEPREIERSEDQPKAPELALPDIAAAEIYRRRSRRVRRVKRGPRLRCRRSAPRSMSLRERPSTSLRSNPALNASALPVSTTTEVAASASKLRAAAVSWRSASGESALMPSPRSNRTTAIRPSGPRPFSIFT
jgi:hypothetical protein